MAAPDRTHPLRKRDDELDRYINLKLAAMGQPVSRSTAGADFLELAGPLLRNYCQKDRQLENWFCPSDSRIHEFLDAYLGDVCPQGAARLPAHTFVLDREGMARVLSLPVTSDSFSSPYVNSYRVPQGVLHNPRSDRRTTQGLFHIAEGGFPIPADKAAVPKQAFAALWSAALRPPADLLTLPFTADQDDTARCFVSLLLRPLVCPAAGRDPEKTMEIRFIAPGSLVSNLDFVESIFGNGGDPYLPENDAGLDALALDRTHRLCRAGAAPGGHSEESSGASACQRGYRAAAARRHVLDRRRGTVQRRPSVQGGLPGCARRHGHGDRRQLLTGIARKR